MENRKLCLEMVNWNEFNISEIFEIKTGGLVSKSKLQTGKFPRITAKDVNNGIDAFYNNIFENNNYRYDENFLSVSFLGSVFYQKHKSSLDMKIHSLKPKEVVLNRYLGLFLTLICRKQFIKYSYGDQLSSSDLPKVKVLLPVDKNGNPNWQFMEDYMRMQEMKLLDKAVKKLEGKILSNLIITGSLSECRWKELSFTEVFSKIQRGKRLTKANQIQGKTPYISSTALNNGVDGFIGNDDNVRKFQNCITLANSGSVGNAFFQQYEFVASDHVTQLKCDQADKYSYLFMLPIISRLSEKYSFNREINDERIKREKLLLPVNEEEEIDFVFMSNFMKNLETETLQNVLKIYNNRLQNCKKLTIVNGGG